EGMELEGVVTNVTKFGAFVDVGVHQDGLVHVSELSDQWVDDPAKVVKVGDKLKVRVLSVDLERRRIALSAKRGEGGRGKGEARGEQRGGQEQGQGRGQKQGRGGKGRGGGDRAAPRSQEDKGFANNPFAKLRR
ncbi:MAG: S1 RNA-binding domain-containing protein, partial [Myxococcales bacterium]|nr:S1 RNA-binding domain-containing protein [Myxococcales bacterium]